VLKENWRLITRVERAGDILLVVLCFFGAYGIRLYAPWFADVLSIHLPFQGVELAPIKDYFIVLVVGGVSFLVSLHLLGAYRSMRLTSWWQLSRIAMVSALFTFFTLSASLFLLKLDLSRSFIAIFCLLVAVTLTLERFAVLSLLRAWRRRGMNFRNVIVCGVGEQAVRVAREIARRPELGLRIRSFADLRPITREQSDSDRAVIDEFRQSLRAQGVQQVGHVLQGVSAVGRALKDYAIDEVIFTDVIDVMPHVEEALVLCTEQGIRSTIAADLFSIGVMESGLSYFGGMPLIHFQTPPGDRWELNLKRAIDVVGACVLLILLTPVFVAVALAVRRSSKGPIFYRQTRVGLNGRLFTMFKFRSMYDRADKDLERLKAHNEMCGPVFKMTNDPRVTPIGRVLRRFSLDELPQLWNVLWGDMSLVGPRPPVPGEVSMYDRKDRRRLSMRPGLTCTWQVSGRSDIKDFSSWVKLDLEYIDNWSLRRDLVLLLQTIPAVFRGSGAR